MTIAARMERLRDEDLVQIANGVEADAFEPAFVEAAKLELQRRGLSEAAIGQLRNEAEQLIAFEEARKDEPLGWAGRLGFMLFGFTILGIFFAIAQRHLGYHRKSSDAFVWTLYGFGFWALIALAFAVTDRGG